MSRLKRVRIHAPRWFRRCCSSRWSKIRSGTAPIVNVRVSARRENGLLRLEVRDRGPGLAVTKDAALRKGIGLSNTAERLERLYGAAHPVGIENAPEGGFVVTVVVPFHVDSGAAG
jgi:signal transduction histidine kinase